MPIWFYVILIAVVAIAGYFLFKPNKAVQKMVSEISKMEINGKIFNLEIADTLVKMTKGLSGRENLAQDSAMLFIFNNPDYQGIWMPNMKFSIDIIWADENYKIVDIAKNVSPETFPKIFMPSEKAKYILEINAGLADKYNIKKGDVISFQKS